MGEPAAGVTAVLCDLEGTLFVDRAPIPGAVAAVRSLRAAGLALRFLSNIDSRPVADVCSQLREMGIEVASEEVFTPVTAAERFFTGMPEVRVLPIVSEALLPVFERFRGDGAATHVVVGDCRDRLSYRLLDSAFRALRDDAELVALQRGRYFKREDGDHLDTGAVVAALEYAAGVSARLLGKPSREFFELALHSARVTPADALIVGDDVAADIGGGRAAGMRTVLVRTGKRASPEEAAAAGHVIDSIANLPGLVASLTS